MIKINVAVMFDYIKSVYMLGVPAIANNNYSLTIQ